MSGKPPRIRDVAKLAGVSPTTVSHVLNEKGAFPEDTRRRVREAAKTLGYYPDPAARRLGGGRSGVIALAFSYRDYREEVPWLLTDIDYFARAIQGATEQALARRYALVVGPPTPQTDVWFRLPLDGVVVFDPVRGDEVPGLLRRRGTPIVVVGQDPNGEFDDPRVDNDSAAAARLALDHLWEAGCGRPAFASYPLGDVFVDESERSYRAWCEERGTPAIVPTFPAPGCDVREVLGGLFDEDPVPDGLVALEDDLGIEAAAAAEERGVRVPEDFAIVAFTDRETFPGIPLTGIVLDAEATARAAVDLLIDRIEGDQVDGRLVEIPVRLVPRASTARV